MATARCLNDDCDKDEWTLTKHPSQYSRGVTCPDCGSSDTDWEADASDQGGKQAQQAAPAQQASAPAQPQQQGNPPAQEGGGALPSTEEAMGVGMKAGDILAGMNSDDPSQKAEATGRGLKILGSMAAQYGDRHERQAKERNQRAKQTRDEDIQVAQDYPSCPECGQQLTDIPASDEFACPSCGTLLEAN